MSKGRRYSGEQKLNLKKVFAVILAIVVLIMFIFIIRSFLTKDNDVGRITSTTYFTIYKDNKWGIIDNSGKETISPSYKEMITIPNNKKDVFVCTYDINDETGEYKTKVLNSKNEEIFTGYEKVEVLENYDKNNNVWYEKNLLKVKKDGKYGLINLDGKEVLAIKYENVSTLKGIENSILVQKDGKIGLVDSEGKTIIDANYKEIKAIGEDYKKGYITIDENNKYGLINYEKQQVLPNEYEKIEKVYGKNLYVIEEAGKDKLINNEKNVVLEKDFDEIKQILQYSEDGIIFIKDGKYGVMNVNGDIIIPAEYEEINEVKDSIFVAKKDGKYGVIDKDKNTKIEFKFSNITYNQKADIYLVEDENYNTNIFDNGFNNKLTGILSELNTDKGYMKLRINDEYKYYNFKFEEKSNKAVLTSNTLFLSKKDGKYGFVNLKGDVVVNYIYDDATEQNEYGYAAVKKDGKWGSVDINGKVVIDPTYYLDNNIVIDFIGKWHLGQDINMNYYCEI